MNDLSAGASFVYPDQRSTFETLVTSAHTGNWWAERVMTSPGYNVSPIPCHQIGVHLGPPVPIMHRRSDHAHLHTFQRGDVIITPAGTPVEYAHPAAVDALYIYLDPAKINATAERMGLNSQQVRLCDNLGTPDPALAYLGGEMLREIAEGQAGSTILLEALTTQLCVHLLRQYAQSVDEIRPPRELRHALEFIHTHLAESLSIAQIAATEHLTPFHFSRLFKQLYAVSPHQYMLQQRVRLAHELLQHTDLPIGEIALRVGFANHSHLTHQFKRLTGQTPLEVRRNKAG
jgi:AraC family transcriptional regulator